MKSKLPSAPVTFPINELFDTRRLNRIRKKRRGYIPRVPNLHTQMLSMLSVKGRTLSPKSEEPFWVWGAHRKFDYEGWVMHLLFLAKREKAMDMNRKHGWGPSSFLVVEKSCPYLKGNIPSPYATANQLLPFIMACAMYEMEKGG